LNKSLVLASSFLLWREDFCPSSEKKKRLFPLQIFGRLQGMERDRGFEQQGLIYADFFFFGGGAVTNYISHIGG
jgi:hypothetical protein